MLSDHLRAELARRLEAGREATRLGSLLASGWRGLADGRLARPLALPAGAQVVGVGSAMLGGAGKTPVAIALARALALAGHEVALVSHAYRARPTRPRRVTTEDAVEAVGDDALHAARELWSSGVPVFVGPSRQAALGCAVAHGARALVVDGLLQAAPRRLAASILVLDEHAPWGSGACPPLGDLRASRGALLAAADLVVVVGERAPGDATRDAIRAASRLDGAVDAAGRRRELGSLRGASVGLLLGVARPERVVRALSAQGVEPAVVLRLADHARFTAAARDAARAGRVDAWLTTGRCATKLPARLGGAPVLRLVHEVDVSAVAQRLLDVLRA